MSRAGGSRFLLHLSLLAILVLSSSCSEQKRKIFIVYMGDRPQGSTSLELEHLSMLERVLGSASEAKEALVYSYKRSFNGFAAKLSEEEARMLSEMDGVVSVIPNHKLILHTTRSWDFLGLSRGKVNVSQEGNVIVGLIDTGIWPESDSFSDDGLGPLPAKWNGKCQGTNFTCNKKIIGAQYYNSENFYYITDFKSPRDSEGHGSHTASTAAGRVMPGASYFGMAKGIARGGVPGARIAVYKVCWFYGCFSADILAAFDDAIGDGVDIISISIGTILPLEYLQDPIAIGSFHAMKHGVLVSSSAGNFGPTPSTVSNYAPWMLTVAASTIDRKFVTQVVLGNGKVVTGLSINNFNLNGKSFPLIWGGDAANYSAGANSAVSKYCLAGDMNSYEVQEKIVFCETLSDGSGILVANGSGIIMADSSYPDFAFSYPLPATAISTDNGKEVLDYIQSTANPIATILVGETWKDIMAPYVVSFSSRGPNPITPDILKPDMTAPGVDILAAWSPAAPPSLYAEDTRKVKFNIISGTSMSCPHASGAAAYIKAAHPHWSPAAIKSAIMTTATMMDTRKHNDLEFAYGSGQLNPSQAIHPGLIYDATEADYINFLCKQGYNTTTVRLITGDNSTICNSTKPGRAWDLNYPSFALAVEDGKQIMGEFPRTVTNVGSRNSTYAARICMPPGINATVEPNSLSFSALGQKKTFKLKVLGPVITQRAIVSGALIWEDGVHVVKSPVVIYNILPGAEHHSLSFSKQKPEVKASSIFHKNGILGHK